MKRFLVIILAVMTMLLCVGCDAFLGDSPKEYVSVSWSEIKQDVKNNRARANQKYLNQKCSFYGELSYISNDASKITIDEIDNETCSIDGKVVYKDTKDRIINEVNLHDILLIEGKVKKITYYEDWGVLELDMDIYDIYVVTKFYK